MKEQNNIANSLSHTRRNRKHPIAFAPKYRKKVFYEEKRLETRGYIAEVMPTETVGRDRGRDAPDPFTRR